MKRTPATGLPNKESSRVLTAHRRNHALVLILVVLAAAGMALAQEGTAPEPVAPFEFTLGTQVILPDGSRCMPLPPAERNAVAGAPVAHYCGDGMPKGLVGSILESEGQLSLEVTDLSEGEGQQRTASGSRLALFDVQRLILENGGICLPAGLPAVEGDDRPVSYDCEVEGQQYVALGTLSNDPGDDYPTSYVTLARVDAEGAVAGSDERVAVAVIDGAMPFTRNEWVLSSWGTGQAPPLEGYAPTLTFQGGMVSGSTGCNSYFAPASILREGHLELGVAGSTLMACPEEIMAQEFRFMAALDGVSGYEYIAPNLYLYGGAEVITFSPRTE